MAKDNRSLSLVREKSKTERTVSKSPLELKFLGIPLLSVEAKQQGRLYVRSRRPGNGQRDGYGRHQDSGLHEPEKIDRTYLYGDPQISAPQIQRSSQIPHNPTRPVHSTPDLCQECSASLQPPLAQGSSMPLPIYVGRDSHIHVTTPLENLPQTQAPLSPHNGHTSYRRDGSSLSDRHRSRSRGRRHSYGPSASNGQTATSRDTEARYQSHGGGDRIYENDHRPAYDDGVQPTFFEEKRTTSYPDYSDNRRQSVTRDRVGRTRRRTSVSRNRLRPGPSTRRSSRRRDPATATSRRVSSSSRTSSDSTYSSDDSDNPRSRSRPRHRTSSRCSTHHHRDRHSPYLHQAPEPSNHDVEDHGYSNDIPYNYPRAGQFASNDTQSYQSPERSNLYQDPGSTAYSTDHLDHNRHNLPRSSQWSGTTY